MKDIKQAFGNRMRQLRLEKGWSQEELAQHVGLHRTYIGSVERGERHVSLVNIVRLADALNVELKQLFRGVR